MGPVMEGDVIKIPRALRWIIAIVSIIAVSAATVELGVFIDHHTTSKAERIAHLQKDVKDLQARVKALEESQK
jgi:hypothetical protein